MFSSLLRKTSFLVLASVCLSRGAAAQDAVLQVGANILVGRGPEGRLLVEPHLAAHPTDPHHLLAVGWVTTASALTAAREGRSVAHCATFLSSDSGRSWARRDLTSAGCGDPWVALTAQGPAVLTALGRHASLPDSGQQLLVFFSGDGGRTWHDVPQSLGRGHDAPRAAAASDGTVYILSGQGWRDSAGRLRWSVFVGRARPGRLYVEILPRIFPSNLNLNSDGLAVLSDGALVITYNDYQRNVRGFTPDSGVLKGRRTWAMLSTERGEAFSIPLLVTESCYTRPTFLAVDTSSGPYRD
ncbi:MAG: exo-alpha-sialidase, partial [Gemmatimonadetes bacterium]|nr:exo-alpha-sialidase [Gemmatimonadota bacterium]